MDKMKEIWKPIKGYEGLYDISSLGRVRSLSRVVESRKGVYYKTKDKILNPWKNKTVEYLMVTLYKNGKSKKILLHRLLAIAFIPNPYKKPCIDHINGNRTDNRLENLRWCTYMENTNSPLCLNKMIKCMEHLAKRIAQISIIDGSIIETYNSSGDVERKTGFHRGNITACCRGESETSYGYKWKYI